MPIHYDKPTKSSPKKGKVPKKPNGSVHKQMIKDLTQISKKGINMNSSTTMTKRKKK